MQLRIEGPAPGQFGKFADGGYWTSVDTTILACSPAASSLNGETVDGYVLNPELMGSHGFDSRYDMGKRFVEQPDFPIQLREIGDVFISMQSQRKYPDHDGGSYSEAQAIIRMASPPAPGSFAPPLVNWKGRTNWEPVQVDVAKTLARLPVFSAKGLEVPPAKAILERIDHLNLYMIGAGPAKRYYGNFFPLGFGSSSGERGNYGKNLSRTIGTAFLALITDAYTPAEREAILVRLLHMGIQWYEPLQHGGDSKPNGGINQFQFLPIALYLYASNRLEELDAFLERAPLNQSGHFFRWDAAKIAELEPHEDLNKQMSSRLRPLLKVEGEILTFETIRPKGQGSGDPGKFNLKESWITRAKDRAKAKILSSGAAVKKGTGSLSCRISSQPTPPFQVGDLVYFVADPSLEVSEGLAEYSLEALYAPQAWQPTPYAAYRAQIDMTADAIAHQVFEIGKYTQRLTPMRDYVKRVNNSDDKVLPPVGGPYLDSDSGTSYGLDRSFWRAHHSALGLD